MKEWVVNDPSRLIVGHNALHVDAVYLMGCVPRVYSVHHFSALPLTAPVDGS